MLLMEDVLNVLMMVPVGFLMPAAAEHCRLRKVILAVLFVEVSIETLQFFLKRGLAEWDDIFHGLIGGICGYCLYQGVCWILSSCRRSRR